MGADRGVAVAAAAGRGVTVADGREVGVTAAADRGVTVADGGEVGVTAAAGEGVTAAADRGVTRRTGDFPQWGPLRKEC